MKKLYIILSILICANSIFAQKLPQNLKKVTNIGYINGQVSSVDLTEMSNIKTPFGNIKCFGTVSFYPSENVKSFTPAASGTLSTPLGKITYKKNEPIVLVCVLKGAFVFCAFLQIILLSAMENAGVPKEDIAMFYPLGMKTKIVDKRNLRCLVDMSHQRMCTRAYWEYRQLMKDLMDALKDGVIWNYTKNEKLLKKH